MASANRRWIPPVLIAVALAASVVAYGNIPATVTLDLAGLLPFDVADDARPGPRWVAAFLIPVLALLVWAALRWATTAGGERFAKRLFPRAPESVTSAAQFERFGKSYDAIVLAVVLLILGFHAAFLAAALGAPALAVRI